MGINFRAIGVCVVVAVFFAVCQPVLAKYDPTYNRDWADLDFEHKIYRPADAQSALVLNGADVAAHLALDAGVYDKPIRLELPDSVTEVWVERYRYNSANFDHEVKDYYQRQKRFWLQACIPIILFYLL
ncbi:MAG: hypothetical protein O3A01_06355 [bacterium]|nr:hypothetical protein [bacterium]